MLPTEDLDLDSNYIFKIYDSENWVSALEDLFIFTPGLTSLKINPAFRSTLAQDPTYKFIIYYGHPLSTGRTIKYLRELVFDEAAKTITYFTHTIIWCRTYVFGGPTYPVYEYEMQVNLQGTAL